MKAFFSPIDQPQTPTPIDTNPTPDPIDTNPTPDPIDTNPTPTLNPEPVELKSPKKEKDDDDLLNTKKKPTRTSDVWDNFVKIKGGNPNDPRCTCKYCGADYACHSTRVGTSSLWGHLKKCKKYPNNVADKKQKDGTCDSASKTINKEKRQRRLLENYMQQQQLETTEKKNDVDIYLAEEPLNPMIAQFDILLWWKDNASRYKTLSMIAKDILVIPVSTVASESAFSTSGRILDPFRSSLSPKMLEALVCTQSSLKGRHDGIKSDTYLDESYSYEFLEHEEGNLGRMKECAEPSGKTINIDD
ncbi:hypothetical protein POM88_024671 [Heracleum sosnowskyi]|uniref:BED-type domain-containing protein n=1 Tax=Heracleum sosnowskyi TaxID=360622 RepID=A0AAD8MMA3_9APIA|nr:hypothetical protein POM88_024671 [Heracleum sosnowskyi]